MCNHIIPSTGAKCKNKTNPYCHLHRALYNTEKKENPIIKDVCPVCMETTKLTQFKCTHQICMICIIKASTATCPICRANLAKELPITALDIICFIRVKNKYIDELEALNKKLASKLVSIGNYALDI